MTYPDHLGNNDLVMATPAATHAHYMSRLDYGIADHYVERSLGAGIARRLRRPDLFIERPKPAEQQKLAL